MLATVIRVRQSARARDASHAARVYAATGAVVARYEVADIAQESMFLHEPLLKRYRRLPRDATVVVREQGDTSRRE